MTDTKGDPKDKPGHDVKNNVKGPKEKKESLETLIGWVPSNRRDDLSLYRDTLCDLLYPVIDTGDLAPVYIYNEIHIIIVNLILLRVTILPFFVLSLRPYVHYIQTRLPSRILRQRFSHYFFCDPTNSHPLLFSIRS